MYFSTVDSGVRRGWKLHKEMTMNLFVPVGQVSFWFHDEFSGCRKFVLGLGPDSEYSCLHVPPCLWFAFEGLSPNMNLLCNLSSIAHSESEIVRQLSDNLRL